MGMPPQGFSYALKEVNTMPRKPKRPCSYPGCRELTDARFCEKHQKLHDQHYNKYERNPETRKRYGWAWKKIRNKYIKNNPLCEQCLKEGRLTPAQEVHHIKPLSKGGTHDEKNLMALCSSCHSTITAREGGRWDKKKDYQEVVH